MKITSALAFLLVCVPGFAGEAAKIEQLGWFAGCWGFERKGMRYEEVWLPPAADGAIGMARTLKQGRSVNHEFTRIVAGKDGAISYVANPSRQTETIFPLLKLEGTRAVFENLSHDFPTRVIYHYTAPDKLDARIEGIIKGKPESEDYPFRRVKCPGQ